jgi:NAD(P)H dehydrogenase (quinone)
MRILVVFSHPARESFCGSILDAVLDELTSAGHQAEVLDLYAEKFDPVMSGEEWQGYEGPAGPGIQRYADQIQRSEGVIWVFPTWNYGLPAILKGYLDRVWKPNVAFRLDQSRNVIFDSFSNLKFFFVVTTYGAGWLPNTLVGNPCKRVLSRCLRRHFSSSSKFVWLALYGLDKPSPRGLEPFLEKVRSRLRSLFRGHARN